LDAQAAGPKQNCLVLDFAGNTRRLGPINDPVIPNRKLPGGGGSAPVRICEVCGTYNHASLRFCIYCNNEFLRQVKLTYQASTDEIIRTNLPKHETFNVDRVIYHRHHRITSNKPPSIKVSYFCGLRLFEEWLCPEHGGYPTKKFRDWWRLRSEPWQYLMNHPEENERVAPFLEPPDTVANALSRLSELRAPTQITVWVNRPRPEITGYKFKEGRYVAKPGATPAQ
jgi:DNA repair protein RadD